jgi:hypothetical protein
MDHHLFLLLHALRNRPGAAERVAGRPFPVVGATRQRRRGGHVPIMIQLISHICKRSTSSASIRPLLGTLCYHKLTTLTGLLHNNKVAGLGALSLYFLSNYRFHYSEESARLTKSWRIVHQKFPGFHKLMLKNHENLPLIQSVARQVCSSSVTHQYSHYP